LKHRLRKVWGGGYVDGLCLVQNQPRRPPRSRWAGWRGGEWWQWRRGGEKSAVTAPIRRQQPLSSNVTRLGSSPSWMACCETGYYAHCLACRFELISSLHQGGLVSGKGDRVVFYIVIGWSCWLDIRKEGDGAGAGGDSSRYGRL
jgi:hypothetical protein